MTGRGVRVLAQMIAVVVAVAMVGAPSLYAGTTVPAPSANDRSFFSTPRGSAEQGAAIAPSTLDAPLPPHLVPIAQLGGNVTSVVADMNLAYVGVGPRVVALDLSDPLAPVELGRSEPLGGVVQDLCLAQDVLYVAAEDDGVHVISLFSQALLGGLAHIETSQAARCLELLGDWLYVAEGDGLRVLDVRDPSRPLDAGHRAAGDDLHDLVAVGDTLYAAGDSGLVILDVGDPRVPTVLARVTTTHPARSVAVQGGLALVGEGAVDRVGVTGQLHAVDIQKPAEPIELGACTVGGLAHDILFYLDHALVACGQGGVWVVDVSNPRAMQVTGETDTSGTASQLCDYGAYVLVADRLDLLLLNVADLDGPQPMGSCDASSDGGCVAASGRLAYVTGGWWGGLSVVDASDPLKPAVVGSVETPSDAGRLIVDGDYAYLMDYEGLTVVDVSNPKVPVVAGACASVVSGIHAGVAKQDSYLYAVSRAGLMVFDVSDPTAPRARGLMAGDGCGYAWSIAISGTLAIVGRDETGLDLVDVSDPDDPRPFAKSDVIGHGHAIEMIGGYALVADGGYGLRVMDLNDPETPAIAATLDIPGWTFDVECIGGLALVLAKEYSQDVEKAIWLHVVDIGDPLNLRPIGAHCLGQSDLYIDRHALAAAEGLLYVLIQGEGVEVYDISQPSGPALVRSLYSSWDVSGLAAGADALTVLNGSQLYLVDVADPAALRTVGNAPVPMWPQQVAQGGAYVYVTGWTSTYEGFPLIPGVSGWLRTAYLGQGNPRPLGMVSFRAHARGVQGVAVADGVVCVTVNDWWQFSLAAYAVGEDGILLERGACELDHAAYYVAVEGARAVVVGDEALTVVDLAGGGPPLPRGTNENLNAPQGVALHKNHAYVADGAGGLCVVSIADLDAPRIVGRCVVGGDAGSVALLGHHAYVGVRGLGVVAVDVADPAEPHVVSLQATPGNANCVTVCGDHVVVGDGPAGLTLYEPVWRAHLPCALSGN